MPRSTVSTTSRSSSNRSVASIAARVANSILNDRAEKKWYVLDISNSPSLSASSFTDLYALITQGDQYNQRNGDQIRPYRLLLRFQTVINPSASWTGTRVLVLRSKGGAQTVGSLLVPHVSATPMYGAVNVANCEVLYDKTTVIDTYGSKVGPITNVSIDLGSQLVQYASGSSSTKRPVYLLIMSDAVSLTPSNQGFCVIKYMDI